VSNVLNVPNAGFYRSAKWIHRVFLGEVFLGFMAIVAAALTTIPLLFTISERTDSLLEAGQWFIVLLFAAEYVLGLVQAPLKRSFVLSPWRLVDAATIIIPLATLSKRGRAKQVTTIKCPFIYNHCLTSTGAFDGRNNN
jgi:hypothetical protein